MSLFLYHSLIWLFALTSGTPDLMPSGGAPEVTQVFPSSDTLPENLLRIYIHFSQPMKTVGNLDKIQLVDEEGKEVKGAIFDNQYELWDPAQKQLTLILDPARVKTGLKANQEFGRALRPGKKYRLQAGPLEDAEGRVMASGVIKEFYVGREDDRAPDTEQWKIEVPQKAGKQPLSIHFPGMLDHFSLQQRVVLVNENGKRVPGEVRIGEQEKSWQLFPDAPWPAGNYTLYVHARLEDPAGNNLNGLFDHKVGSLKYPTENHVVKIPIAIE